MAYLLQIQVDHQLSVHFHKFVLLYLKFSKMSPMIFPKQNLCNRSKVFSIVNGTNDLLYIVDNIVKVNTLFTGKNSHVNARSNGTVSILSQPGKVFRVRL